MLSKVRFPNAEFRTGDFPLKNFDDVFAPWIGDAQSDCPRKLLFCGEEAGGISSYGAGWMAGKGIDVIVLDGANRLDPYKVSFFAKKVLISPEILLKRIQIARAFTCYQMVTLIGEKLVSLLNARAVRTVHACTPKCGISVRRHESPLQKPWVILLGLITPFLDEDVPEREVRPLFEKILKKMESLAAAGVPFFLFQPLDFIHSKRSYLGKRLFQFSDLVLRIDLDSEEPKMVVERIGVNYGQNRSPFQQGSGTGISGVEKVPEGIEKRRPAVPRPAF